MLSHDSQGSVTTIVSALGGGRTGFRETLGRASRHLTAAGETDQGGARDDESGDICRGRSPETQTCCSDIGRMYSSQSVAARIGDDSKQGHRPTLITAPSNATKHAFSYPFHSRASRSAPKMGSISRDPATSTVQWTHDLGTNNGIPWGPLHDIPELFSENIVAKLIRSATELLQDNVSYLGVHGFGLRLTLTEPTHQVSSSCATKGAQHRSV